MMMDIVTNVKEILGYVYLAATDLHSQRYHEDNRVAVATAAVVVVVTAIVCWACCTRTKSRPINIYPETRHPTTRKIGWDISKHLLRHEIGENFNDWRYPVPTWGIGDDVLSETYERMSISRADWNKATQVVDNVMSMMLYEMKRETSSFPGLTVKKFVKQGSAREGLKVDKADEFDLLLLFEIQGLNVQAHQIKTASGTGELPEFCRLVATKTYDWQTTRSYPTLVKEGVLLEDSQSRCIILNSRNLHERVFKSIIQKAANSVERAVREKFTFEISKYRINPPSVNIEISFEERDPKFDSVAHIKNRGDYTRDLLQGFTIPRRTVIDVDIVPGLLLSEDTVPDPTDWQETMKCPRYAVFKWYNNNQPPAGRFQSLEPGLLWRVCSSGYERHVLDVARGSRDQCYFITALRVIKHELREMKMDSNPEQLSTVVRSYFVKHVAFYCILNLCVMNKRKLTGVGEALAYLLDFLRVALEERRLPHFFHGNPYLVHMFPDYPMSDTALWYNLFLDKSPDALLQAEWSLRRLRNQFRIRQCLVAVVVYPEYADIFRSYIQSGEYYDGD